VFIHYNIISSLLKIVLFLLADSVSESNGIVNMLRLRKEIGFMESILTSIKKVLGITEEYEHFDADLIMHINSVFMVLNQLGVGPPQGFAISSKDDLWTDFISEASQLELVKSYIYLKVKLLFDPPLGSAVIDVMNRQISEFEWRLNVAVDPKELKGSENQNGE